MSPEASPARLEDLNRLPLDRLYDALASGGAVRRLLRLARDEDLGEHPLDATTNAIPDSGREMCATVVIREPGIIAGLAAMPDLARVFGEGRAGVDLEPLARDGHRAAPGSTLMRMHGPASCVLMLERTMLNLLGRLCGVATRTERFVARVRETGSPAAVLDTRKTTPGIEALEKYAVRCGGGSCHRMGLADAVLIKDNHLATVPLKDLGPWLRDAARRAWSGPTLRFVEVEVDTLEQLERALAVETGLLDIVLLDNMTTEDLAGAVAMRDRAAPGILLEASGGVTLDTIGAIAETGVDRISVGSLTHHAPWLDLGLDVEPGVGDR